MVRNGDLPLLDNLLYRIDTDIRSTIPIATPAALDARSNTLSRFFRGLGDATRLRILFLLVENERTVSELVALLGSPQGRVSTHLACLRWCGFVAAEKEGRTVRYRIADPRIRLLLDVATSMLADNASAIASCLIVGKPTEEREAP